MTASATGATYLAVRDITENQGVSIFPWDQKNVFNTSINLTQTLKQASFGATIGAGIGFLTGGAWLAPGILFATGTSTFASGTALTSFLGASSNLIGSAWSGSYNNASSFSELMLRMGKDAFVGSAFSLATGYTLTRPFYSLANPVYNGIGFSSGWAHQVALRSLTIGSLTAGQGITSRTLDLPLDSAFGRPRDANAALSYIFNPLSVANEFFAGALVGGTLDTITYAFGGGILASNHSWLSGESIPNMKGPRQFIDGAQRLANMQSRTIFQVFSTVVGTNTVPVASWKFIETLREHTLSVNFSNWSWAR